MSAAHPLIDRAFTPAPAGIRVRATAWLMVAVLLAILTVNLVMATRGTGRETVPGLLGFLVVLVVSFSIWVTARIRSYRIANGELVVDRFMLSVRFPLAGLESATPDREAMKMALRTFGNSGLGSVCGRFRSSRLGKFRAYVSDVEKAIVLRWPDRTVVVSPDRQYDFLGALKPYLPQKAERRPL